MSDATMDSLVKRARQEFGLKGYAEASVEHIAGEVGLTKGAVYYHFKNKKGFFEAVLRDCQRDIVTRIEARATSSPEPRQAIVDGCLAFLDVVMDEELRQVVLVDGPAVLGYGHWRRIDSEFGLGSLKEGLQAYASDHGPVDVDVVAHTISGALNDLVLFVSESSNRTASHRRVRRQLPILVASMLDSASVAAAPRRTAARAGGRR
ncbi:MAG: TetR/AcrR family transcriptional regulator [Myxococcota bacterium]